MKYKVKFKDALGKERVEGFDDFSKAIDMFHLAVNNHNGSVHILRGETEISVDPETVAEESLLFARTIDSIEYPCGDVGKLNGKFRLL